MPVFGGDAIANLAAAVVLAVGDDGPAVVQRGGSGSARRHPEGCLFPEAPSRRSPGLGSCGGRSSRFRGQGAPGVPTKVVAGDAAVRGHAERPCRGGCPASGHLGHGGSARGSGKACRRRPPRCGSQSAAGCPGLLAEDHLQLAQALVVLAELGARARAVCWSGVARLAEAKYRRAVAGEVAVEHDIEQVPWPLHHARAGIPWMGLLGRCRVWPCASCRRALGDEQLAAGQKGHRPGRVEAFDDGFQLRCGGVRLHRPKQDERNRRLFHSGSGSRGYGDGHPGLQPPQTSRRFPTTRASLRRWSSTAMLLPCICATEAALRAEGTAGRARCTGGLVDAALQVVLGFQLAELWWSGPAHDLALAEVAQGAEVAGSGRRRIRGRRRRASSR